MVEWGNYAEAYKAIHEAIRSGLVSPPEGKKITKLDVTYDGDKDVETIKAYENSALLFTLTFSYDGDKDITSIVRSEP